MTGLIKLLPFFTITNDVNQLGKKSLKKKIDRKKEKHEVVATRIKIISFRKFNFFILKTRKLSNLFMIESEIEY